MIYEGHRPDHLHSHGELGRCLLCPFQNNEEDFVDPLPPVGGATMQVGEQKDSLAGNGYSDKIPNFKILFDRHI